MPRFIRERMCEYLSSLVSPRQVTAGQLPVVSFKFRFGLPFAFAFRRSNAPDTRGEAIHARAANDYPVIRRALSVSTQSVPAGNSESIVL